MQLLREMTDRMSAFFRNGWKQLLAIGIAIALPICMIYAGRPSFWPILTDSIFELGAIFFVAAMLGRWGKAFCHIVFLFALLDFGLSLGCYLANGQQVSIDTYYLIVGTNKHEVSEFFDFYFPLRKIIIWSIAVLLLCLLYFSKQSLLRPSTRAARICAWVFLVAAVLCFPSLKREIRSWCSRTIPLKYVVIARMYEPYDKVASHRHDIPIAEVSTQHPPQVLVVIGESFSKSHSSLYGYGHDTNPELAQMASAGNLFSFTHCEAPAPFTHLAFKNFLSLWDGKSDNWYEHPTLFDVFSQKYTIRWISNQQDHGMHENAQVAFANLSDTVWFACRDIGKGSYYDEVLLNPLRSFAQGDSLPALTIVNLMGQHEAFIYRYPKQWEHFKADDYQELPAHQRQLIAQYDNSTRYNDHIVASIFDLWKDQCVLAFYFPDHGLDLYETRDNYCGHALENNQRSWDAACQIPFFIYVSDSYREAFPEQVERISQSLDKPFNTRDFIYALLQLTGWRLPDKTVGQDHLLLAQ